MPKIKNHLNEVHPSLNNSKSISTLNFEYLKSVQMSKHIKKNYNIIKFNSSSFIP